MSAQLRKPKAGGTVLLGRSHSHDPAMRRLEGYFLAHSWVNRRFVPTLQELLAASQAEGRGFETRRPLSGPRRISQKLAANRHFWAQLDRSRTCEDLRD